MGRRRVTVAWAHFGPYHHARLEALREVVNLTAVQYVGHEAERGWGQVEAPDGLRVVTLFPGRQEGNGTRGLARAVWGAMEELKPEAVLVPGYADAGALAMAGWAKRRGVPAVLMSESTVDDRKRAGWKEWVKRGLVSGLFDAAVVGGKRTAAYVEELGIPRERIGFGYNTVDNEYFARGAERWRRQGSEEPYFLYVGRLSPEKNLQRLSEAYGWYRERGGRWELVVVGGGPLEGRLRGAGIRLEGRRTAEELLRYYAHAGALVLPSLSEPWGLVVNEAMAAELPVLVSDRCGCADDLLVDGGNGWLLDPLDVEGMAERMVRMEGLSEEARRVMGARSRAIIADYTPERFAAEVKRLVDQLLA